MLINVHPALMQFSLSFFQLYNILIFLHAQNIEYLYWIKLMKCGSNITFIERRSVGKMKDFHSLSYRFIQFSTNRPTKRLKCKSRKMVLKGVEKLFVGMRASLVGISRNFSACWKITTCYSLKGSPHSFTSIVIFYPATSYHRYRQGFRN